MSLLLVMLLLKLTIFANKVHFRGVRGVTFCDIFAQTCPIGHRSTWQEEDKNLHVHHKWACNMTCSFCEPNFLLTKSRNTWSLTAVMCQTAIDTTAFDEAIILIIKTIMMIIVIMMNWRFEKASTKQPFLTCGIAQPPHAFKQWTPWGFNHRHYHHCHCHHQDNWQGYFIWPYRFLQSPSAS